MDFSERVKDLRLKAGLTQEEVGERMSPPLTKAAIGAWEAGRARPRLDKMQQLADLFGVTVSELMGESVSSPVPAPSITVPVAVAGHAGEFTEEPEPGEVAEVPLSVWEAVNDPDAFLIRVRGNCMSRRFCDGENALASPRREPRNGDAVVVEKDGELLIREYFKGASTLVLSPDSYDEGYEDIVFSGQDGATVSFQGTIMWHQASRVRRY